MADMGYPRQRVMPTDAGDTAIASFDFTSGLPAAGLAGLVPEMVLREEPDLVVAFPEGDNGGSLYCEWSMTMHPDGSVSLP